MNQGGLRPLGLGELLDAAIKIYRARWKDLMAVTALFVLPSVVLQTLIRMSTGASTLNVNGSAFTRSTTAGQTTVDNHLAAVQLGATFLLLVLSLVTTAMALAGVLRCAAGVYLGEEVGWRESAAFAFRRAPSVLWVLLLVTLAEMVGLLLCCVGYFAAYGFFFAAVPVLLIEGTKGTKALSRSRELVEGRFWPTLGTLFLGSLLAGLVSGAFSVLLLATIFSTSNEVVIALVTGVTTLVSTTLVTPFTASLAVAIYFDLRVRKEGFDLWLLARSIGVEPAAGGFPAQPGAPAWSPPPWGAPGPGAFGGGNPSGPWYPPARSAPPWYPPAGPAQPWYPPPPPPPPLPPTPAPPGAIPPAGSPPGGQSSGWPRSSSQYEPPPDDAAGADGTTDLWPLPDPGPERDEGGAHQSGGPF